MDLLASSILARGSRNLAGVCPAVVRVDEDVKYPSTGDRERPVLAHGEAAYQLPVKQPEGVQVPAPTHFFDNLIQGRKITAIGWSPKPCNGSAILSAPAKKSLVLQGALTGRLIRVIKSHHWPDRAGVV